MINTLTDNFARTWLIVCETLPVIDKDNGQTHESTSNRNYGLLMLLHHLTNALLDILLLLYRREQFHNDAHRTSNQNNRTLEAVAVAFSDLPIDFSSIPFMPNDLCKQTNWSGHKLRKRAESSAVAKWIEIACWSTRGWRVVSLFKTELCND